MMLRTARTALVILSIIYYIYILYNETTPTGHGDEEEFNKILPFNIRAGLRRSLAGDDLTRECRLKVLSRSDEFAVLRPSDDGPTVGTKVIVHRNMQKCESWAISRLYVINAYNNFN